MTRRLFVAESAAAYLQRPRIVVDASVLAASLFSEPGGDQAATWLAGRALCAPHLIDYEIVNVALNKKRRRLIAAKLIEDALQDFDALDIERYAANAAELAVLAERYRLTAYDASYLWLAAALQAPLVSFDERLGAAAQQHLAAGDR